MIGAPSAVPRPVSLPIGARAVLAAAALGVLAALGVVASSPTVAYLCFAAVALALVCLLVVATGHRLFWALLLFLLAGYAFFSKGFAYLGWNGVYVGELCLGLGLLTLLVRAAGLRLRMRELHVPADMLALGAFIVWQIGCTLPYLERYGADALRDAVLWGYAAFAFLIVLVVPRSAVDRFPALYGRCVGVFLAWLLAAWVLGTVLKWKVMMPGTGLALLQIKAGDVGVHLGGVAAFLLLRLEGGQQAWRPRTLWLLWLLWWACWVPFGIANRAGMISALLGLGVTVLLRPRSRWDRPLVMGLAGILVLLAGGNLLQLKDKSLSLDQVGKNLASVVSDTEPRLDTTKQWRLEWWQAIIEDTVQPDHAVFGQGYGLSLGERYGRAGRDGSLRSPHNAFMTILARSGLPGLILWVIFLAALLVRLLRQGTSPPSSGEDGRNRAVWLLAYLVAFIFHACFDVFLEGPMGGIWFWSLVGVSWLTRPQSDPSTALNPGAQHRPGFKWQAADARGTR
jgi:O-antigen ligase